MVIAPCYDHLAGRPGVAIFDALVALSTAGGRRPVVRSIRRRAGQRAVSLTESGGSGLGSVLGIDVRALRAR
jgi:hypothetical protein